MRLGATSIFSCGRLSAFSFPSLFVSHQSAASSTASPGWELGASDDLVLVSLGSRQHEHRQASLRPHYHQSRFAVDRHEGMSG